MPVGACPAENRRAQDVAASDTLIELVSRMCADQATCFIKTRSGLTYFVRDDPYRGGGSDPETERG